MAWFDEAAESGESMFSSTLLELEITRALRREDLDPRLGRVLLNRVDLVGINDGVLRASGAIEPHVKSLDAIHLATCLLLGSGVIVVTHDVGLGQVAQQLALDTFDPLASGA